MNIKGTFAIFAMKHSFSEVPKGKILAFDFGTKRIGYAISDAGGTLAFPRSFLATKPYKKVVQEVGKMVKEEGVSHIIFGLPLDEENEEGDFAKHIRCFGEKLARDLGIGVEFVDEFGSTSEAIAKIPFRCDRRKKGMTDAIAAQVILRRYLDEK